MNSCLKTVLMIILCIFLSDDAFSQSASAYFKSGVKHLSTARSYKNRGKTQLSIKEYDEAIKDFGTSKVIDKSAKNLKKCNAQIALCKRERPKKIHDSNSNDNDGLNVIVDRLAIEPHELLFEAKPLKSQDVKVESSSKDWFVSKSPMDSAWCRTGKEENGRVLTTICLNNNSTLERTAKLTITMKSKTALLVIKQKGKDVELAAESPFVNVKKKGGQKVVYIGCNSDSLYSDGNNWTVVKMPVWCKRSYGNSPDTSSGQKWIKSLPSDNEYKNISDSKQPNSYKLVFDIEKIDKSDPDYKKGRTGDIVLRSQSKEYVIRIDQK